MKKTVLRLLQMTGLILMLLTLSCNRKPLPDASLDTSLDYTPLFNDSLLPLTADSLELSEGGWFFKKVYAGAKSKPMESKCTMGKDELSYSFTSLKIVSLQELDVVGPLVISLSQQEKTETTMDARNKKLYEDFAKIHGKDLEWKGNTLVTEYSSEIENTGNIWLKDALELAAASYGLIKTNAAGSRYLVRYKWNASDIYYFAKKEAAGPED